ncbi:MAG TPA: LuxR C-terminal-related transcriptional regulator, partial [Bryobacteraceae bacterium]|nr:LuxR C-terminal-related transcriptional regulator [Bryobacteraceae bacterium]
MTGRAFLPYTFAMSKEQPRRWAVYPYTDRELEVVALSVQGVKPEEISRRLLVTPHTVYQRLSHVYSKAGIAGAHELTDWAERYGLDAPLP